MVFAIYLFYLVIKMLGSSTTDTDTSKKEQTQQITQTAENKKDTDNITSTAKKDTNKNNFSYNAVRLESFGKENILGDYIIQSYVEILNDGDTPIYLDKCSFDIEDNDKKLLATEDFVSTTPNYVLPGEKGYFHADYIDITNIDDSNGININANFKVEEAKRECHRYPISDTSMQKEDYGVCKVLGRLTNDTDKEISMVYVDCIFYDAEGNVLGFSGTNVMGVEPNDKQSFEIRGQFFDDDISFNKIASYTLIASEMYIQF